MSRRCLSFRLFRARLSDPEVSTPDDADADPAALALAVALSPLPGTEAETEPAEADADPIDADADAADELAALAELADDRDGLALFRS